MAPNMVSTKSSRFHGDLKYPCGPEMRPRAITFNVNSARNIAGQIGSKNLSTAATGESLDSRGESRAIWMEDVTTA
eukprot:2246606-Prymnesium_polylepis.1